MYYFFYNKIFGDKNNSWSKAISYLFLKKYDLDDFNSIPCLNKLLRNDIINIPLRNDVPFPIINASVTKDDLLTETIPLEFTPLYYGLPVNNNNIYKSNTLIEPIGFNNISDFKDNNKNEQIIDVKVNDVISIANIIGMLSNAIGSFLNTINKYVYKFLDLSYINYFNNDLKVVDVSTTDDTGVITLLRRKVKKIIVVCSLTLENTDLNNLDVLIDNNELSGLFGIANIKSNPNTQ